MKRILLQYKLEIIGALIGSVGGFAYWYFVGCASGSCAITSSPTISTLYGALTGALLLGLFKNENKLTKQNETRS